MLSTAPTDRYTLVRPLGRGASGEVWEAVLHGPGGFAKHVALKRLRQGPEALLTSLLDEARLGAKLQHPNIVGVYGVEAYQGAWCIAMELVTGATLRELLALGPVPASCLAALGAQLADALDHVHSSRIDGLPLVHRDVKPANVLVDQYGVVKLTDFGVATTSAALAAGTPGYAAPEQIAGATDPRSDLFGLGMTLAVAALGGRPVDLPPAVLASSADAFEDRLKPALDGVAPGLGRVVVRCLRADPSLRYGSARAVAAELRGLAAEAPPGPSLQDLVLRLRPELVPGPPSGTDDTVLGSRHNVSPPPPPLVGRAAELDELLGRLASGARLVTVLGPGGAGKTRLALEVTVRLGERLHGGAWFVDLTEARSAEGVRLAVARALDVELPSDEGARLGRALDARGRVLLVLDNVEQVVDEVATELRGWLRAAPRLTVACTSRVALELADEELLFLGPLSGADGAALFLARSRRQDPVADVVPLVEQLEGSALALELAAARAGSLPLAVLREQLGGGGLGLRSTRRDLAERQRSVEASLRWSWDLATPWARSALAQLSVTEGGFDARAAAAILDLSAFPGAGTPLDVLHELVHASLLQADRSGRFRLLVSIKEFAARALTGPDARAAALRHARWYAQLDAAPAGGAELDNLVTAADHALEAGEPELAARAALAVWAAVAGRGPLDLGQQLLERVLDRFTPGLDGYERLWSYVLTANFARWSYASLCSRSEALLAGPRPHPHPRATWVAATMVGTTDPTRAVVLLDTAEVEARALGDLSLVALVDLTRSKMLYNLGDVAGAVAAGERSRGLAVRLGDRTVAAEAREGLGALLQRVGRGEDALQELEAAVSLRTESGEVLALATSLEGLATLRMLLDEPEAAHTDLRRALELLASCGAEPPYSAWLVQAQIAAALGRHDEVPALLARTEGWRSRMSAEQALSCRRFEVTWRLSVGQDAAAAAALAAAGTELDTLPGSASYRTIHDVLRATLLGPAADLDEVLRAVATLEGRSSRWWAVAALLAADLHPDHAQAVALAREVFRGGGRRQQAEATVCLARRCPWDEVAEGVEVQLAALRGTHRTPLLAELLAAKVAALATRDPTAARRAWHELAALLPLGLSTKARAAVEQARRAIR